MSESSARRRHGEGESNDEPGGNRTHNPQIMSRLKMRKNGRNPNDFARGCADHGTKRHPDVTSDVHGRADRRPRRLGAFFLTRHPIDSRSACLSGQMEQSARARKAEVFYTNAP